MQNIYLQKGRDLYEEESYEEAIISYDRAIKLDPLCVEAYKYKGDTLRVTGRAGEALESYDKAIELAPNYLEAYCAKARVLIEKGEHEKGLECYTAAITLCSGDAEACYKVGYSLDKLRLFGAALGCYDNAIRLDPGYAEAYYAKALILMQGGAYEEALECCNAAIYYREDYAEAHSRKGDILQGLGRHGEALDCYDKSIGIDCEELQSYYAKGEALHNLGRYPEALRCNNIALSLWPGYEAAQLGKSDALCCMAAMALRNKDLILAESILKELAEFLLGEASLDARTAYRSEIPPAQEVCGLLNEVRTVLCLNWIRSGGEYYKDAYKMRIFEICKSTMNIYQNNAEGAASYSEGNNEVFEDHGLSSLREDLRREIQGVPLERYIEKYAVKKNKHFPALTAICKVCPEDSMLAPIEELLPYIASFLNLSDINLCGESETPEGVEFS